MILDYGFSLIGKSHIEKNTCCQDSHCIKKMKNGWFIAAIADGVGSASNSHIGSRIAANTVVEFCDQCMPWDYNIISIKSMLRTAYNYAYKLILRESEKSGEPIESYDTTLSVVIYDGQRIIYGHSGDGAIIGLTSFGDFVEISRAQKGPDGISVIPLRGGYTQWVIDTYEEDLVAVLLMTDGMFETLCPYLLKDSLTKTNKIYTPLGSFFADPKGFSSDEEGIKINKKLIEDFLIASDEYDENSFYARLSAIYKQHIPDDCCEVIDELKKKNYPVVLMKKEQDDKTIVGLINTETHLDDKDKDFYAEPDWSALQEAWNRKAYPHLYEANKNETGSKVDGMCSTSTDDTNKTDYTASVFSSVKDLDNSIRDVNEPEIVIQQKSSSEKNGNNLSSYSKNNNTTFSQHQNETKINRRNSSNFSGSDVAPKHSSPKKSSNLFEKTVGYFEKGVIGIGRFMEDLFADECDR